MVQIGELYRNWVSRATYSTRCNLARHLVREATEVRREVKEVTEVRTW